MPELIDKKHTEAKVFLIARFFIDRPDREIELVKAVIHRCCEEIDKQPTIEPEVRHGRWIEESANEYYCSYCGKYAPIAKNMRHCDCSKWCKECGTKMDGGADNG